MGEGILIYGLNRTKERNYYRESKRLREEVLASHAGLKGHPLNFRISNGISMNVEISYSDIKTIVSKNTRDNRFNAFKNALAKNVKGFIAKGKYLGWRETIEGKHPETAYFAYYGRGKKKKAFLCLRKMKNGGKFKPYAIIDENTFKSEIGALHKTKPPS